MISKPKHPLTGGEKDVGISPEVKSASTIRNDKGPMSEAGKMLKNTEAVKNEKKPKGFDGAF